jgi:hypothetical protein
MTPTTRRTRLATCACQDTQVTRVLSLSRGLAITNQKISCISLRKVEKEDCEKRGW